MGCVALWIAGTVQHVNINAAVHYCQGCTCVLLLHVLPLLAVSRVDCTVTGVNRLPLNPIFFNLVYKY